jgi:hypothetical protein
MTDVNVHTDMNKLEESKEQQEMTVAFLKEVMALMGSGKYNRLAILNALLTAVNNCVYEMGIEKQRYLHRVEVMYDMLHKMQDANRTTNH